MRPMRTYRLEVFSTSLVYFLLSGFLLLAVSPTATDRGRTSPGGTTMFLLTGFRNTPLPPPPAGHKVPPKEAETEDSVDSVPSRPRWADPPQKPLPQIMLPRNLTSDALKPPLGAAQVAPPPRRLVDVDVCRGYYDVMGQFDITFNCSRGTYIYCCGTCHYRFCCEHQRDRLDQEACNNYISPVWANTQTPGAPAPGNRPDPDFDPVQQQSNSTAYVIGGVISFTLVVAVGIKVVFHKLSRRPRNRDINMPRALVDILRHQSSPVQPGERNNSTVLTTSETGMGRPPKNLYTPVLQSKDNRKRVPRMNNAQLASTGTLLSSKHNNSSGPHPPFSALHPSFPAPHPPFSAGPHPSFSHSFHNLAQLPPSYEAAMKPEINRYSSLKRLEKDLDEYTGYCSSSSKRRPNNAPPSFHSSQHHLHWGGDYTLGARGTLPLHTSRPRIHVPASTPNPYPLPAQSQPQPQSHYPSTTFDKPPRRVMSQDQLLAALGEGSTLSRLTQNQQLQYYKAISAGKSSNTQAALRKSHERLLVSPDRLEERMGGMGGMGGMGNFGGMVPSMPHLSQHHKAQSQQNICVTPSLDRHHMIKMNSHPLSGHEHERSSGGAPGGGMYGHGGGGWGGADPHGGGGAGGGPGSAGGGHSARRMAFASKRQNTIEQLHFIPGGGGGGGGGGGQGLRTASKNEVTV